MLRELPAETSDWDEPLSADREAEWVQWRKSLKLLEDIYIPWCHTPTSLHSFPKKELCVFSDASTMAVGAVAYIKATDNKGQSQIGFVMWKSKLAPKPAHTVPQLELCAAVLAMVLYEIRFFTDS